MSLWIKVSLEACKLTMFNKKRRYCLKLRKGKLEDFDFTILDKVGDYSFSGKKAVIIETEVRGEDLKKFIIDQIGINPIRFALFDIIAPLYLY